MVEMGNCRRVNSSARSGMLRSACSYSNILTRTARFRAFPLGRTIRRRFPAPSDTSVPSRNNCRNAVSTVPWLHPSSFASRSRPGKNSRQRPPQHPLTQLLNDLIGLGGKRTRRYRENLSKIKTACQIKSCFHTPQNEFNYHMSQNQTAGGPHSFTFEVRSSLDSFASAIPGTYSTNPVTAGSAPPAGESASFDLSGGNYDDLQNITFRLYLTGSVTGNNDVARWNNILVEGSVAVIPEPTTALLGSLGLLLFLLRRRR